MSKFASVRAAFQAGGAPEVVKRTRLWAASRIYPGVMPQPRPPLAKKAAAKKAAAKKAAAPRPTPDAPVLQDALKVDHEAALAFFENRRASYEHLADVIKPYLDPDGVFYDVGANIGFFTRVVAERTGFRGTVHLFEPVPNLARLCRQTLADVPFTAHLHEFGLSNEDSSFEIYTAGDGNLGWNTMVADRAQANMTRSTVEVRAFASLDIDDVPAFIKIDVEGAEHLVITGMLDSLARWERKPVILCEVAWGTGHPQWEEELAAFQQLADLGYRVVDLEGAPFDLSTLTRTTDLLFLPERVPATL